MTLLTDQVAVCKDSGLLATFEIHGEDFESISSVEAGSALVHLEAAFNALKGDQWGVWFTLKRFENKNYPSTLIDDQGASTPLGAQFPMASLLDAETRKDFLNAGTYSSRAYVSLYLAPHAIRAGKGASLDVIGRMELALKRIGMLNAAGEPFGTAVLQGIRAGFSSQYHFAYKAHELSAAIESFERTLEHVVSVIPEIRFERLKGTAFLSFLRSTLSGHATPETPVSDAALKGWDWFMDSLLPDSHLEVHGDHLRLGDQLVSALSIKEWPAASDPRLIPTLLQSGAELTVSTAFNFMNNEDAQKFLSTVKGYANLVKFNIKGYISAVINQREPDESRADRAALDMHDEAEEAQRALNNGDLQFGLMNVTVLVHERLHDGSGPAAVTAAEQRLHRNTRDLQKMIAGLYPGVIRENLHLLSAWSGTMPGQWSEPVRWAFLNTGNLADSAPLFGLAEGDRENAYLVEQTGRPAPALAVLRTIYNTPYYFNFHNGALAHTFVVGPTRGGKSVFINYMNALFVKYHPSRVIIFDKDRTARITTHLLDGKYISMTPDQPMRLNPVLLADDPRHRPFLLEWVIGLIESKGYKASAEDRTDVADAIANIASLQDQNQKTLTGLYISLPQHLKVQLGDFVRDTISGQPGIYHDFFDNVEDSFELAHFTAIEMGPLMSDMPAVARAFIDYAFYRIMDVLRSQEVVTPTLIYLEECWFLFENAQFRAKVRDWLKTLAKYTAFLVMATQSIEDMANEDPKFFSSIRDSVPTRIFLPNPAASTEHLRNFYRSYFGLDDQQIHMIATCVRNRDYIISRQDHTKLVVCRFNPKQLAVLRSDSKAQIVFDRTYDPANPHWKEEYIHAVLET
jgi:type IV secretion system protein VirB4